MSARTAAWIALAVAVLAGGVAAAVDAGGGTQPAPPSGALANPAVDPGTPLGGRPAPGFTLTDQFGRPVSLASLRGRVVVLAFLDSRCTTICPLTTVSLTRAVHLLGPAGQRVTLIGIDANPRAISVADVRAYSDAHQMTTAWHFLTGTASQLSAVWRAYGVYVAAVHGSIDHQPAIYVIDPAGRERLLYVTQMAYAGVAQQAQVIADGIGQLLHARVTQATAVRVLPVVPPGQRITLAVSGPGSGGRTVTLGPGQPHLVLFFATWLSETSDLPGQLLALNRYAVDASGHGWPGLVAVDEASTEPAPAALATLLRRVSLRYPVVVDRSGQLADGYRVQDAPWLMLVSVSGRVLFTNDGWFPLPLLERAVQRALGH